jgi:hypothetical protein
MIHIGGGCACGGSARKDIGRPQMLKSPFDAF